MSKALLEAYRDRSEPTLGALSAVDEPAQFAETLQIARFINVAL